MIYTYECEKCGEFDVINKLADMKQSEPCPKCGRNSKKVIVMGHGGIQREDPSWIQDVNKVLADGPDFKPMRTISDLRKFYTENPNIRPKESHPAFSSSLGDSCVPETKQTSEQRRRKACERVREMRSISI